MGKTFDHINEDNRAFIGEQKMFFVATAAPEGRVNLSPKGLDTLLLDSPNRVAWLNLTGSGNETAAHLLESDRMTMMFCAFEGKPRILRLYGHAHAIHPHDSEWESWISRFDYIKAARQVLILDVDLVQISCGFGVPLYDYVGQRDILETWADRKGADGVRDYWLKNNVQSLDGKDTGLLPASCH